MVHQTTKSSWCTRPDPDLTMAIPWHTSFSEYLKYLDIRWFPILFLGFLGILVWVTSLKLQPQIMMNWNSLL